MTQEPLQYLGQYIRVLFQNQLQYDGLLTGPHGAIWWRDRQPGVMVVTCSIVLLGGIQVPVANPGERNRWPPCKHRAGQAVGKEAQGKPGKVLETRQEK